MMVEVLATNQALVAKAARGYNIRNVALLLQVLLDLDLGLLREFFRAFFADPSETMWRKFLAWDMTRCPLKKNLVNCFLLGLPLGLVACNFTRMLLGGRALS